MRRYKLGKVLGRDIVHLINKEKRERYSAFKSAEFPASSGVLAWFQFFVSLIL